MPFFAEHLFQVVREEKDEESVHLGAWPSPKRGANFLARLFGFGKKDDTLLPAMQKARDIVSQALEAREKTGIKVRQPLLLLTIPKVDAKLALPQEILQIIADEVNVKKVQEGSEFNLDTNITPELKEEGEVRDLIRSIQVWRKEQGLKPGEKAVYSVPAEQKALAEKHKAQIEKTTSVTI